MSKLIILDLFGTLVKANLSQNQVRPGFQEFFEHYKREGNLFVICSDGSERGVKDALLDTGLLEKFDGVYDERHLERYTGQYLKDLAQACQDFDFPTSESVFIGDDFRGIDSSSAYYAQVPFIQVPQFREISPNREDIRRNGRTVYYDNPKNPFSFSQLIGRI